MTQGGSWNSNPFMHIPGQGRNISRWAKHCPSSPSLFKEHSWESCPFHVLLLPELSPVAVLGAEQADDWSSVTEEEGEELILVSNLVSLSFLSCLHLRHEVLEFRLLPRTVSSSFY